MTQGHCPHTTGLAASASSRLPAHSEFNFAVTSAGGNDAQEPDHLPFLKMTLHVLTKDNQSLAADACDRHTDHTMCRRRWTQTAHLRQATVSFP